MTGAAAAEECGFSAMIGNDHLLETVIRYDHLLETVIRNDHVLRHRSVMIVEERQAIKTNCSLEHVTVIKNDHILETVIRNDRPDIL